MRREFGFVYKADEENPIPLPLETETTLEPQVGGTIYGYSHSHPPKDSKEEKVFPMFSIEDIYEFARVRNYYTPLPNIDNSVFFATLTVRNNDDYTAVNPTNTYAIKLNDWQSLKDFAIIFNSMSQKKKDRFARKLQKKYEKQYRSDGSPDLLISERYEKILFKFMADNNIGGIDIYKAKDKNLDDWEKLNYNSDDEDMDDPTDCQYQN